MALRYAFLFLVSALLVRGRSASQPPPTREVSGTVIDQSGSPLKGAVVQIEDSDLPPIRSYITQADGKYHFAGLNRDIDYRLTATYEGVEGPAKTLSKFDSRAAKIVNLEVRESKNSEAH